MDRLMFVVFVIVVIIFSILSFVGSFNWILMLCVILLALWVKSGSKKIEVGWKGQLLLLGKRIDYIAIEEGWHWIPIPLGIKIVDCREVIVKLDPLEVKTKDDVMVKVDGSIKYKIKELYTYFSVNELSIKNGIDEIWDQEIRSQISEKNLEEVFKMRADLKKSIHDIVKGPALTDWGISVTEVIIASIKADDEITKDLELKKREELQRRGQIVELEHFKDRVNMLMCPPPKGAGLSREQAIEQVQLSLGKIEKKVDAKTIALDTATVNLASVFLGGKK